MKKIIYFILFGIAAMLTFSACSNYEADFSGEGKLKLKVAINETIDKIVSRSSDELAENCTIYVYNSKALVRKYHGLSEIPSEIALLSGNYRAEAWAGDSVDASFTQKYFKGTTPFTISKGSQTVVTVECKIANVVASVNFDSSLTGVLSDYAVSVGNSKASLDFTAENASSVKGYYMMPDGDTNLTYVITGKQIDGTDFRKEGVIENVKRATEYALTIKYSQADDNVGGAFIEVEVDESTLDINESVTLKPAPTIYGSGFDISQSLFGEQGSFQKRTVYITAVAALTNVVVSCDYFTTLGFPANEFDLINMSESAYSSVEALGLTHVYTYIAEDDNSISKISFSEDLLNSLPNGIYNVVIKATDVEGKTSQKTVVIEVSDALVVTKAAADADIKQYSATLRGTIAKAEASNIVIKYRKQGESQWQSAVATVEGDTFYAKVTGLTASTTYDFMAACDSFDGKVLQFTTGADTPLTNGGFEDWFTDSEGALVPSLSADNLFWDTGNHGSITLNQNITTKDTSIKHGGTCSIKMQSAYVALLGIGKFAAGNVFVGKYLKTDGTNGILGFGRPFTARPKAIHGYVKYRTGNINYTSSDIPEVTKDMTDKGTLYFALTNSVAESYDNTDWSFVIRTKSSERRLFDKNDSRIIAFGEMIWDADTEGDDMVEFTIPITYYSDETPSYMMLVGSASYWGDYFVGSTSATMWLDDIEFVYE